MPFSHMFKQSIRVQEEGVPTRCILKSSSELSLLFLLVGTFVFSYIAKFLFNLLLVLLFLFVFNDASNILESWFNVKVTPEDNFVVELIKCS